MPFPHLDEPRRIADAERGPRAYGRGARVRRDDHPIPHVERGRLRREARQRAHGCGHVVGRVGQRVGHVLCSRHHHAHAFDTRHRRQTHSRPLGALAREWREVVQNRQRRLR
eukprot:1896128-Pleurochrysis_carterae.AAC.1